MNENLLKETLNTLADQAIPTDYDPTPSVRQHIETNLHIGRKHLDGKQPQVHLRMAGVAGVLILLMGVIFLLTPPGRGFAQEVIRFFNFAESDVLPLPTGQPTELPLPTRTPAPTQLVKLQEGTPVVQAPGAMSYPTKTPIPTTQEEEITWNLSLDEAEQLAGFNLRIPASLAPGYRLDNVIYEPTSGEVIQFFEFHPYSAGEMFLLGQRQSTPDDVIGKSATVEQITIGETTVEYVEGAWSGDTGLSVETWGGGAPYHTFRWQEGENYFTLVFLFDDSDTWSPAYWTKEGMLAMAEIIMGLRKEYPTQLNLNNITSIEQAEQIAGFDLLAPSVIPEGFVFTRAVYEPEVKLVRLFYQPQEGTRLTGGVSLMISESQDINQPWSWEGYPPEALEEVLISGNRATFGRGSIANGTYQADDNLYLVWHTPELSIQMAFRASTSYPARLEKDNLLVIAESME